MVKLTESKLRKMVKEEILKEAQTNPDEALKYLSDKGFSVGTVVRVNSTKKEHTIRSFHSYISKNEPDTVKGMVYLINNESGNVWKKSIDWLVDRTKPVGAKSDTEINTIRNAGIMYKELEMYSRGLIGLQSALKEGEMDEYGHGSLKSKQWEKMGLEEEHFEMNELLNELVTKIENALQKLQDKFK